MATKKPDVADSWEEIDEERLPGTISILKNTSNSTGTTTKPNSRASTSGSAARLQDTLPQMLEEELRPKMIPRPMQILKRPQSSAGTDGKSPTDSKPKTQIKSLDQRKQEYAEARLRILGSAHDDEEAETKKVTPTTTSNTTASNGYRINNANNNNNNSNNSNGVVGGGSAAAGSAGVGVIGSTANSNANNAYRYHSPYRQQAPIGTFPPSLQNAPSQGLIAPMYYPSMGNQSQHHPMHSAHGMHHPPSAYPHVPHHHLQHNNHPYQHQQHFGQHINPPTGSQHLYGGRNGGNAPGGPGYFAKGGPAPYAEANGAPLLGHAPPGVHHNHTIPYGGAGGGYGQTNSHGNLVGNAGANIGNNQHVLRLPAGPDGSQGFNVRR
uniref:SUZ RNA-binding domain-containing n=1 Tax=Anopheles atroparvus TaxID=41427 RepID=A0AAG5DES5_ANOAO